MTLFASKNSILRYRVIDKCLKSKIHPYPSKLDLRKACEQALYNTDEGRKISDSTIEKDLYAMRNDHGAPIAYDKYQRGYFYTDNDFSLEESPLNGSDLEAIKTAAKIFDQFKSNPLLKNFEFAINKILDRINVDQNLKSGGSNEYVRFDEVSTVRGNEFLEPLLKAITGRSKVQFIYGAYNKTDKRVRRVHPYLLKEYRHRWYLIGYSEIRDKILTFGLDRIYDLEVLSDNFTQLQSFNPDAYFKYSIGITVGTEAPEKIKFRTTELLSKYLISQPLHDSQTFMGEKESWYHFELHLIPTIELRMQLMSYGSSLEVIHPTSFRNEIKEEVKKILDAYT